MKESIVVSPNLAIVDGRPVTSSLDVAEKFEKRHDAVLRSIRSLECSQKFIAHNFVEITYLDSRGRSQPMFQITRDGFSFLAMGFTGKAAAIWKERYIEAFNAMEKELLSRATLPDKSIDINHYRRTGSPDGLDIRYTLDLTRIVLNPTSKNLTVLERVTGIDMSDLIEEMASSPGFNRFSSVASFVGECCEVDKDAIEPKELLFSAYCSYCGENGVAGMHRQSFFRQLYHAAPSIRRYRPKTEGVRSNMLRGLRLVTEVAS